MIKVLFIYSVCINVYMYVLLAGRYIFYISIIVYLYGDMTIYSTAVAKSIRDVAWFVQL
jgi:hypothetical protein